MASSPAAVNVDTAGLRERLAHLVQTMPQDQLLAIFGPVINQPSGGGLSSSPPSPARAPESGTNDQQKPDNDTDKEETNEANNKTSDNDVEEETPSKESENEDGSDSKPSGEKAKPASRSSGKGQKKSSYEEGFLYNLCKKFHEGQYKSQRAFLTSEDSGPEMSENQHMTFSRAYKKFREGTLQEGSKRKKCFTRKYDGVAQKLVHDYIVPQLHRKKADKREAALQWSVLKNKALELAKEMNVDDEDGFKASPGWLSNCMEEAKVIAAQGKKIKSYEQSELYLLCKKYHDGKYESQRAYLRSKDSGPHIGEKQYMTFCRAYKKFLDGVLNEKSGSKRKLFVSKYRGVAEKLIAYIKLHNTEEHQQESGRRRCRQNEPSPLGWNTLTAKALEFAKELGVGDDFKASPGWISTCLREAGYKTKGSGRSICSPSLCNIAGSRKKPRTSPPVVVTHEIEPLPAKKDQEVAMETYRQQDHYEEAFAGNDHFPPTEPPNEDPMPGDPEYNDPDMPEDTPADYTTAPPGAPADYSDEGAPAPVDDYGDTGAADYTLPYAMANNDVVVGHHLEANQHNPDMTYAYHQLGLGRPQRHSMLGGFL